MRRDHVTLHNPFTGAHGGMVVYGHYGRPMLAFPSQQGVCTDYESLGMIESIASLIDEGRVKVYCVDSFDSFTWQAKDAPMEERAARHGLYEDWILNQVVPWIWEDCGGRQDILINGPSFGGYHAANFCLKHADIFPVAICQSGVFDVSVVGWGDRGDGVYFNNPMDYVANMDGGHLDWLRSRAFLLVVCGQGQWEDTTGSLESAKRFADVLGSKGIPHELDLWGHDVPHDWPSWRAQLAHHLPRFC